jgi:hypothetical protein
MKRTVFIPLAAVLLITAATIISCEKSTPPGPSANLTGTEVGPLAYLGGNNWNILYYFGTPDYSGCVTPCGLCHMTPSQSGYLPDGNNPDNNEALGEISVIGGNRLLISVDLSDVGAYYVNDILTTGQFNVSTYTEIPQDVIDAACDRVGVPHWGGPNGIAAANYPVHIESTAGDARLEMEGTNDAGTGWSWICYVR